MKTKVIKPLMVEGGFLDESDIRLIRRKTKIQQELKDINAVLKPRIKDTIDQLGEGKIQIGSVELELVRQIRNSVSWQGLAHAEIPQSTIDKVKSRHTSVHEVDSVQVVKASK
jgi:hypothetical protein